MGASFKEGEIAPFQSKGRSQYPWKIKKAAAAAAKTKAEGGWKRGSRLSGDDDFL